VQVLVCLIRVGAKLLQDGSPPGAGLATPFYRAMNRVENSTI